ncbi:hypothetical protein ACTQXG_03355 [Parabacteroides distasonis]
MVETVITSDNGRIAVSAGSVVVEGENVIKTVVK